MIETTLAAVDGLAAPASAEGEVWVNKPFKLETNCENIFMATCKKKTTPKGKKALCTGPRKPNYRGYPNDGKDAARPRKQAVDTAAYAHTCRRRRNGRPPRPKQMATKERSQAA